MLTTEYGSNLVGYTGKIKCRHCNNTQHQQVRQDYIKKTVLLVPAGTSNGAISLFCPTCEKTTYNFSITKLFAKNYDNELLKLLDGGEELTKHWAKQLSYEDREQFLKRLNALKLHSLVKFIAT
jgi:hypothetical protein